MDTARFNARLSLEQKALFERASILGGYRSLTDFIFKTAQMKAEEIIKENEKIIASERDSQLFYDVVTKGKAPSRNLKNAYKAYQEFQKTIK
ncbi:MAG: DUF1778 domain-containing protein [Crocinitomicaceae bacterium]|nr:DUF1778 domain-containing protein [Crocinitomicaceae bacterium]